MADVGGAERLAARLLGEVEECGLSELLASLRTLITPSDQHSVFNIPELDALLPAPPPQPATSAPLQQHERSDDDTWDPNRAEPHRTEPYRIPSTKDRRRTHVIELVSAPPQHHPSPAGKTSLIHLITTHAILPSSLSNVAFSGLNAAVIIFDPLHHFSVPFLARTALKHITSCFKHAGKEVSDPATIAEITQCVHRSLSHVHIFRPASWDSLLVTLGSLESYLFDSERHASKHRAVHSIILEDLNALNPSTTRAGTQATSQSANLSNLPTTLSTLATLLSCTILTTSTSTTPSPSSFRPPFPLRWPANVQLTRLAVRRVEVLKFAPGISMQEAEAERAQRWEVVGRGRFEVWRVGSGGREGGGFVFRVRDGDGVRVEREEG